MPGPGALSGKSEQELWPLFRQKCPGAERIENSVSSGLPDIIYPTERGWFWLELKLRYGQYFYMQKYQLAFAVKTFRLGTEHVPHYILYDHKRDACQVFDAFYLLDRPRFPYDKFKFKVEIDDRAEWMTFDTAVGRLGALRG